MVTWSRKRSNVLAVFSLGSLSKVMEISHEVLMESCRCWKSVSMVFDENSMVMHTGKAPMWHSPCMHTRCCSMASKKLAMAPCSVQAQAQTIIACHTEGSEEKVYCCLVYTQLVYFPTSLIQHSLNYPNPKSTLIPNLNP